MTTNLPTFPAGKVFKPIDADGIHTKAPMFKWVEIEYPIRLNGMSIDTSKIAVQGATSFPAGEICFSISNFVHTKVTILNKNQLLITPETERKAIVKHAVLIMCKALGIQPSFRVSVELDKNVQKHSGFGSSGAIIASVCVAINELYGNPINTYALLEYMANNYGEEVCDSDENNLQLVQCIGGSLGSGLSEGSITIIAGNAVPIISQQYDAKVLIAIPKDFYPKSASDMMHLEEQNLHKFTSHGEKYAYEVAYNLIHVGIPLLKQNDISGICDLIYHHRFEMGSIQNCSFVYPAIVDISYKLKYLYEKKYRQLVSMSSVGPLLFIILNNNKKHQKKCFNAIKKQNLNILSTSLYNDKYKVTYERKE